MIKYRLVMGVVLLALVAYAKEPKLHQSGKLLQMESVPCGVDENSGKSVVGEIIGTDSAHKKTHELLCQDYVLQSDKVIYRIRPRDEKHPVLLPVGETGTVSHAEGQDDPARGRYGRQRP